ncbi:MAG: alanine:cation symporter family protein [Cytophagaceae bacterium]|nr:alanine:cation symporter family protein [Cytophagaceae bacterium]MDW8456511.1 alanine/glycine:cation symporter family protein [Cytophagaceae bacterium]
MNIEKIHTKDISQQMDEWLSPVADCVSSFIFYSVDLNGVSLPIILIWLMAGSIFFTIYFRFINVRYFFRALYVLLGRDTKPGKATGEVSHFQALTAALSGTVGLGNIAGVGIAIATGGPGATFWMIVAGFLGMSSKFVECTLAVKYRKVHANGSISGGPMYYLSKGFEMRGYKKWGKTLAILFSIMCVGGSIGGGNMFQSNQAVRQIVTICHLEQSNNASLWLGILVAFLVGVVIIGGIKTIARVTDKLVPFMCVIYLFMACCVLLNHHEALIPSLKLICVQAFTGEAVSGGVAGVIIAGLRRACFSNEAGIGSAPIAHATAKTDNPLNEGFVSLLEPFIDTVIVCTATALMIIVSGAYEHTEKTGIELTSHAVSHTAVWLSYLLAAIVFFFAYSTIISWSYYGLKAWTYITGDSYLSRLIYKSFFCALIPCGAVMQLESVINFSDAMIFAMALPNMVALYVLAGEVKSDLRRYEDNL